MPFYVGIRREDKSYWERRVPLPPHSCAQIMQNHPHIKFVVQPCNRRIYSDLEYIDAGCLVNEDLNECGIIVCLKEIPVEKFLGNKTYIFWSCVTKGEKHNLPMLETMIQKNIRHIDYERILDDKGTPAISFPFAGIAGVLVLLSEFGKVLLQRSINNQFLYISSPYQYVNTNHAFDSLSKIAQLILKAGLSKNIGLPFVIGILGSNGKCGQGALQALSFLPIKIIKPIELESLFQDQQSPHHQTIDLVEPLDSNTPHNSQTYYNNPSSFKVVFGEKYLKYMSLVVNAIYWTSKFPRYITKQDVKILAQSQNLRLQGIVDISCDLEGSIEFMTEYTVPEKPVYFYHPITEEKTYSYQDGSIMYSSIHFLPSMLPQDASDSFGEKLIDVIPKLVEFPENLPTQLQNAVLCEKGQLTEKYKYLEDFLSK